MTDAKLVVDVGVGRREVGHGVPTQQQTFEHGPVDDSAGSLLVGADRLQTRLLHRRFDEFGEDLVEVDLPATRIGLSPKRHQHEAEGPTVISSLVHESIPLLFGAILRDLQLDH